MPTIATIVRRRGALALQLAGEVGEHLLARESVEASGVREGTALAEAEWTALRAQGRERLVLERALLAISRRALTERELRDRLARQFEPDEIDLAVVRLTDLGYLDDQRRAVEYVEARRERYGSRRLRQDLARRGIPRNAVEAATDGLDEAAVAIEIARRRLPSLRALDEPQQRRRLYGYLQRRGFGHEVTRQALTVVIGGDELLE